MTMYGRERPRFVEKLVLGMWQANCFIVGDRELGRAFVVDPGEGAAAHVPARLEANGVGLEAVLLTHGHLDHLWGVPELVAGLDVPVRLHAEDRYLWDDPAAAFGGGAAGLAEQLGLVWEPPTRNLETFDDGQAMTVAGFRVRARHTPGHTPGSSIFLLDAGAAADDPLLLSGDLVFAGSVGRTDFPRGSTQDLLASIARVVLPLDDATVIASGHGPETTVGRERRTNPFLDGLEPVS